MPIAICIDIDWFILKKQINIYIYIYVYIYGERERENIYKYEDTLQPFLTDATTFLCNHIQTVLTNELL